MDNLFEHYGTRDAAHEWDGFANKKIAAVGYQVGLSSPCIYVHSTEPSIGWRPGDDILFAGEEKFVAEILYNVKGEMVLKKRAKLGFAEKDDKHCRVLNRLIDFTFDEDGPIISYEPVCCLSTWDLMGQSSRADETELESSRVGLYRSCVLRLGWQFCANRLALGVAKPTRGHWNRLKRSARYLKTHGRWDQ